MTDMQPEYRIPDVASAREEFKKKNPPLAGPSYGVLRTGNSGGGLSIEEQQARRKAEIVSDREAAASIASLGDSLDHLYSQPLVPPVLPDSFPEPRYEVVFDEQGRMDSRPCNGE
ncbi:MAG: hypothetical protein ACKO3R_03615 [bacterium]